MILLMVQTMFISFNDIFLWFPVDLYCLNDCFVEEESDVDLDG